MTVVGPIQISFAAVRTSKTPCRLRALDEHVHVSIFLTEQVDIADMYQGMCLLHHVFSPLRHSFIQVIQKLILLSPYEAFFIGSFLPATTTQAQPCKAMASEMAPDGQ